MNKEDFLGSFWDIDLSLNTYPSKGACRRFLGLFQFSPIFGHFVEIKTKQIKFCINFQVKYAKFLPSKCTRLLLLVKPVQRNCLHFFLKLSNTVRYLSVNEPKLPSRNYFIVDVFTLGSERKSEYGKRTLFWHSQ